MNSLSQRRHDAGITREPLDDLVRRVDMPALVERYSGQGRRSGSSFTFTCPNPQHPDRNPSFTVTQDKRGKWRGICYSQCQWSGDALALVQWLDGGDVRAAADRLRAFLGEPSTDTWRPVALKQTAPPLVSVPAPLPTETRRPPEQVCAQVLTDYLHWRHWPDWTVDMFGLSVVLDDRGAVRVRHTFYGPTDDGCEVLAWQDRAKGDALPKWKGPHGRPLPLYNLPALRRSGITAAVICEGPADTISATVALQGSAQMRMVAVGVPGVNGWRTEWAQLFAGLAVLTAADNDKAGNLLRDRIEHDLAPVHCTLRHLMLPSDVKDMNDWCRQHGHSAIGDALAALAPTPPATNTHEEL